MALWESIRANGFGGLFGEQQPQQQQQPTNGYGPPPQQQGYGPPPQQGYGQAAGGRPTPGYPSPAAATRGPPSAANNPDSFYGFFNKLFTPEDHQAGYKPPQTQPQAYQGNADFVPARRGISRDIPDAMAPGNLSRGPESMNAQRGTNGDQKPRKYVGDPEDLLDQHVAYNLRQNAEAAAQLQITRRRPGSYDVNGRDIEVEWQYSDQPGVSGHLVAIDGPNRMPFSEFINGLKRQQAAPAAAPYGGYGPTPTQGSAMRASSPTPGYQPVQPDPNGMNPYGSAARGGSIEPSRQRDLPNDSMNGDRRQAPEMGTASRREESMPRGRADQSMSSMDGGYRSDKDDLLDQHVAYFMKHHPEVHKKVTLVRKRAGVYDVNRREIQVEWQYATAPGGRGQLVVQDGPLRQPFSDYMTATEANAEYTADGIERARLHQIPQERRLTFGDQQSVYSRLDAMKVAKAQAQFREKAAEHVHQGQEVPADLLSRYEKTLQQKLGGNKEKPRTRPPTGPPAGQPPPGQPAPSAAPAGSAATRGRSPMPPGQPMGDPRGRSPAPIANAFPPGAGQMWTPPPVDYQTPMTRGMSAHGGPCQPAYGGMGFAGAQPLPVYAPGTSAPMHMGGPVGSQALGGPVYY